MDRRLVEKLNSIPQDQRFQRIKEIVTQGRPHANASETIDRNVQLFIECKFLQGLRRRPPAKLAEQHGVSTSRLRGIVAKIETKLLEHYRIY